MRHDPDRSTIIANLGTQTLKATSSYEYNSYGLLTKSTTTTPDSTKPFILQTEYNTDSGSRIFGSIKTTTDSIGNVTKYLYNPNNGRLLVQVQPDGYGTSYSYDSLGNLVLVQPAYCSDDIWNSDFTSVNISYDYNDFNQLSSVSTNTTEYHFTYNVFGAKTSVAVGDDTIISQTFNANNGKISSVSYANGTTVNYFYNRLDQVDKIVYNNSGTEVAYEYEYDSNGNLNKFIDPSRQRVTLYQYDNSGRMTNLLEYDSANMENLLSAWYSYDDSSRLSSIYYAQDYKYNSDNYITASYSINYSYNDDGTITEYTFKLGEGIYTISPSYDGFGRTTEKHMVLYTGNTNITAENTYTRATSASVGSSRVYRYTTKVGSSSEKTYKFFYDSNDNIIKITDDSGNVLYSYAYDLLGRLFREYNHKSNKTYVYKYDDSGNILSKKVYDHIEQGITSSQTLSATYTYTYGNSDWGDQLTSYRGESIIYDAVGNPTTYYNGYNISMTWTNGNNLASAIKSSVTTTYTYNDSGIRTSKTVGGVLHSYLLDGSVILSEEYDGKLFIYVYDEHGAPIGINYRDESYAAGEFDSYLFQKNLLGDITGIFNESGSQVVWYEYDAWGNRVSGAWVVHSENKYKDLFYANPFRYRGYYYDEETGFYYCGSRYYDPIIGRFINADITNTLMNTPMAYTDKNLYAYCDNNPVMRVDNGGEFWDVVLDVISLCASVADVVTNPDDPWAWVGLGADVVSLVVPFATGGGLLVDVLTKTDDVVDLAKSVGNTVDVVDAVTDSAKVVGQISDGTKAATNICESLCFIAGTLVATQNGSIPIENIKKGMLVYATDPLTSETALKRVVNLFVNEASTIVHIKINGEIVSTTPSHPFWIPQKGWTNAVLLRAGDRLQMLNGEYVIIEQIEHEILEEPIIVYNFEVEGFHTYHVSKLKVLVHNSCSHNKVWGKERRTYWRSRADEIVANDQFGVRFDSYLATDDNIARMVKGKAPIGWDGKSVELHHINGIKNDFYNYQGVSRTLHQAIHVFQDTLK